MSKRHILNDAEHLNSPIRRTRTKMSPSRLTHPSESNECDVVVVGAGPAGLMLAANLVRFGIKTTILDDRPNKTSTGRADGIQPKTIETLRQMRLADDLLKRGAKIYDIAFWSSSLQHPMRRTGRQVHYPPVVDLLDPYILLVHQGMVEDVFLNDLQSRGVEVKRNCKFSSYAQNVCGAKALRIAYQDSLAGVEDHINANYLVGCDGAHSEVRKSMGAVAEGANSEAIWGVLDGEIITDFPDLWSKAVVYSESYGSVLCIPRENNMTRLYIELKSENGRSIAKEMATQEYVMMRAREILQPFTLEWSTIEWFGVYTIGQRVANKFTDKTTRVFIAGDASHTHSPKAAQGMNTGIHDSLNLAWKLNLAVRGISQPALLSTYEVERRKIAQDLISFDYEHANAFHDGDPEALAANFLKNIRFISGVGAEYGSNLIVSSPDSSTFVQPGSLLLPAKVSRYVDANPVDIQLDVPMLGQFRIYFICPDVNAAMPFLETVTDYMSHAIITPYNKIHEASYMKMPYPGSDADSYILPERYTSCSKLLTFALLTETSKAEFELASLPQLLQQSRWTVYLDDLSDQNTGSNSCREKWVGAMSSNEVAIVNVRPDGYIGSVSRWDVCVENAAPRAGAWLQDYYLGFLILT